MGLLDFTPYDTSGGVLPIPNNRVSSAFGQFPNWQDEPMSIWDLARLHAQPQQPQQTQPASLPAPPDQAQPQAQPPQQQPMQQPMAQPQSPGFGDRLNAGLMGFANSGAPIPALANLISGLVTGQRSDPAGQQQQQLLATYRALRSADVPHGQALAAALNPEVFKAIAPEVFGNPKVVKVGTDILGREIMKVQQGTKFSDVPGMGRGSANGGVATAVDETKPLYDQYPKGQQGVIDSMLAGRLPPPSSFALSKPYWQGLITAADEKAKAMGQPGFDAGIWSQRNQTYQDFSTKGKSGQTLNALATVQGHLEKLSNAGEELDNGGWRIWNSIRNGVASDTPLDPVRRQALQKVKDAIIPVMDEMARAYKAGQMSDTEIKRWSTLINTADSKEAMRQATADFYDFLETKKQALVRQHKDILHSDPPGMANDQSERVSKLLHDRNVGVGANTQAQGNTPQAAKEGDTATNPNTKQKAIFKGGKWLIQQ